MSSSDKNIQVVTHGHPDHEGNITIKVVIDLEEHCLNGTPHPTPKAGEVVYYRFKMDKPHFEQKDPHITGSQLLALVGLSPQTHKVFELGHGQRVIGPDETVDLRKLGVERFKSVPKEARDGQVAVALVETEVEPALRQQFDLALEDQAFLDKQGLPWETLLLGSAGWLLIHNFPVPAGYTVATTTLALALPGSYPTAEIDMMYFAPGLVRRDGRGINALSPQPLDGKNYQRWSRHRPPGIWRPGIDNIETHVLAVGEWITEELSR